MVAVGLEVKVNPIEEPESPVGELRVLVDLSVEMKDLGIFHVLSRRAPRRGPRPAARWLHFDVRAAVRMGMAMEVGSAAELWT